MARRIQVKEILRLRNGRETDESGESVLVASFSNGWPPLGTSAISARPRYTHDKLVGAGTGLSGNMTCKHLGEQKQGLKGRAGEKLTNSLPSPLFKFRL